MDANIAELSGMVSDEDLIAAVLEKADLHANAPILTAVPASLRSAALNDWMAGKSYNEICAPIAAARVKFGAAYATPEHVVNLCENGFAYDVAMVIAAIVDLVENRAPDLHTRLVLIQKKVKTGLPNSSAIAFHSAGFADRVVSQALAATFATAGGYSDVVSACRVQLETVLATLAPYPSYFHEVARELSTQRR